MLPSNSSNCFTKNERLLKRPQFLLLSDAGDKIHSAHFIVLALKTSADSAKIGITVSRKVGNAVCRNLIRRRVREFYRTNKGRFSLAHYNIIAKRGAEQLNYQQLCNELANALERLHVKLC